VHSITIGFLFWVFAAMPAISIRSWYRIKSGKPLAPKRYRYLVLIALELVLLGLSLLAARENGLDLFPAILPEFWWWLAAAAYLATLGIQIRRGWRRITPERKKRARIFLPETPEEFAYWIPISLLAGICEEAAYRGSAFQILSNISGSAALALIVCVVGFGLIHAAQGWRGILGTMLIGVLFHITVLLTHGLYVAMAFHAAYDLMIGILALKFLMPDATAALSQTNESQAS
jgi:membrane protease YdiL (CAAX protease family)